MEKIREVNQLCIQYLKIDFVEHPELAGKKFFSKEINAMPRDVMVVMLEIERKFKFSFEKEFIIGGGVSSFQSIIDYMNTNL